MPIASEQSTNLAARLRRIATSGTVHGMHAANHKGYSLTALRNAGVPVPDGRWFTAPQSTRNDIVRYVTTIFEAQESERVFFKLTRGASGMGVWPINNLFDLLVTLEQLPVQFQMKDPTLGVVVDKEIRIDRNPNVTVFIGDTPEEDAILSMSDQILEKRHPDDDKPTVHVGNISLEPKIYAIIAPHLRRACNAMRAMGFRGVGGFDFGVDLERYRAKVLEFNGRFNGNNGAAFMAKQAGPEAVWVAHNAIPVPKSLALPDYIAHLQRQGAAYDASRYGVFVTNTGTALAGKYQIGIRAETHEHAHDLLGRAQWKF